MAVGSKTKDPDGCMDTCYYRHGIGLLRPFAQMASRTPVSPVCFPDADCSQFHQRPYRLPQRHRQKRPSGTREGMRPGMDYPRAMEMGIAITLICACGAGLLLLLWGSLWLIAIGIACVVFAFLYTTFLSYIGLGDLLVFVFFGFVPVICTYYVQTGTITEDAVICSLASGLVIDLLLIINNYRDRDTDRHSGKRTLIALFGERFGNRQYLITGILAWACCIAPACHQHIMALVLASLFLPLHWMTWREMVRIHHGKELNRILGKTSRNMFVFAILVALGLIV